MFILLSRRLSSKTRQPRRIYSEPKIRCQQWLLDLGTGRFKTSPGQKIKQQFSDAAISRDLKTIGQIEKLANGIEKRGINSEI